jgi:hypothetical protein
MIGIPITSGNNPQYSLTVLERLEDAKKYRLEMTTGKANTGPKPAGVRDLDTSARRHGDMYGRSIKSSSPSRSNMGNPRRKSF